MGVVLIGIGIPNIISNIPLLLSCHTHCLYKSSSCPLSTTVLGVPVFGSVFIGSGCVILFKIIRQLKKHKVMPHQSEQITKYSQNFHRRDF